LNGKIDVPIAPNDPFAPVELTIDFVDSVAGSRKTFTAVEKALFAAKRHGTRTIFAMPTLTLVAEWVKNAKLIDDKVPVIEITSNTRTIAHGVETLIRKHITSARAKDGHLLFITHEGFQRVTDWPAAASGFELYIDEVLDVILNRKPFKLRDSHWALTSFLSVVPIPATIPERLQQQETSENVISIADWKDGKPAPPPIAKTYYQVVPKQQGWLERREYGKQFDDIYEYVDPIAKWLLQNNALFTEMESWNSTVNRPKVAKNQTDMLEHLVGSLTLTPGYSNHKRGLITLTGFRRPDTLKAFGRVTVMSALFKHTMLHAVWTKLGVDFRASQTIKLAQQTTDLGKRRLRIYWLSDEGWSKRTRDLSGGIENILKVIRDSGVINIKRPVCITVNKDDGSEKDDTMVREIFGKAVVMPHNVRGRNFWMDHHQMIYCAALNSYTSDIRWMESVLGIDSTAQRIGRAGQETYQTLMRLSLRKPEGRSNITLVVMDKDIAEWLVQWFTPTNQVEVIQIENQVIRKKKGTGSKGGRPRNPNALSSTERTRRQRARQRLVETET
jgi:hypothetical protein